MVIHSSWEDSGNSIPFMKVREGNNVFRIVTNPVIAFSHWVKLGAKGTNLKVTCYGSKEDCPLCQAGVSLLKRNCFFVLDRSDSQVKIYEAPNEVYKNIKTMAKDEDYGDPKGYDIKVTREGLGLNTSYHTVGSPKKKPLTDEEKDKVKAALQAFLDDNGKIDWDKIYQPKTRDELQSMADNLNPEFIKEIQEKQAKWAAQKANSTDSPSSNTAEEKVPAAVSAKPKKQETKASADDEEEFFSGIPEKDDFDIEDLNWEEA